MAGRPGQWWDFDPFVRSGGWAVFRMGKDAEQDRGGNAVAFPLGGQFEKTQWGETVKAHRIL